MVPLAVIGVLTSVVACYYYIRIVKVMYFDESAPAFDGEMGVRLNGILLVSGVFVAFFIFAAPPLVSMAQLGAKALLP